MQKNLYEAPSTSPSNLEWSAHPAGRLSLILLTGMFLDVVCSVAMMLSWHSETVYKLQDSLAVETVSQIIGRIALIVGLVWMYQSHKTLERLGLRDLRFSHWTGIWGSFVPIANLFIPYQYLREIAERTWSVSRSPGIPLRPIILVLGVYWSLHLGQIAWLILSRSTFYGIGEYAVAQSSNLLSVIVPLSYAWFVFNVSKQQGQLLANATGETSHNSM